MVKVKRALFAILMTLGLLIGFTTIFQNPAMASSWDRGTPVAIKGYWHNDMMVYHIHSNVILYKLKGSQSLHNYRHTIYKRTATNRYTVRALNPQTGTHLNIRFRTFGGHANVMVMFGSRVYRGK